MQRKQLSRLLRQLFWFAPILFVIVGLGWNLKIILSDADLFETVQSMSEWKVATLQTFAVLSKLQWCQQMPSSSSFAPKKNPCPLHDAQAFEDYRQAEIDAGIQNIYYINLDKNVQRRANMEANLQQQQINIPFHRVPAIVGDEPPSVCAPGLRHPSRCQGVQGILKSNLHIMQYQNVTTGLSLIMEDDFWLKNLTLLQESIQWIPSDWDIIRFECVDYKRRASFDYYDPPSPYTPYENLIFRANFIRPCNESCSYCGGAFAMLWRASSLSKLYNIWSQPPARDLDCRLAWEPKLRSYCINTYGRIGEHKPPWEEDTDIPKERDPPPPTRPIQYSEKEYRHGPINA